MRQALQRAWLRRGPLARLLFPVSVVLGLAVRVRRVLFRVGLLRAHRAPVPVIVIGNVVAGGAGKTPVVIAVAQRLTADGIQVGVVSRGHGRQSRGCREVRSDSDPADAGDEPLLVARRTGVPVFVSADRPEAIRALLRAYPETRVVVSDDGLQHHAMARDVEVCVFDDRGAGNGWLLPAGPLREPWPRPVDLVLRTDATPGVDGFLVRRRLADEAVRADGHRMALASLSTMPCDALAGTARPQAFFDMLAARGVELRSAWPLPDHHAFASDGPWSSAPGPLLCTEKDAVKLWRHRPDAWAVPLEVDIDAAFWDRLLALLHPKLSSTDGPQTA